MSKIYIQWLGSPSHVQPFYSSLTKKNPYPDNCTNINLYKIIVSDVATRKFSISKVPHLSGVVGASPGSFGRAFVDRLARDVKSQTALVLLANRSIFGENRVLWLTIAQAIPRMMRLTIKRLIFFQLAVNCPLFITIQNRAGSPSMEN